jgi:hypothetical protein
MTTLKTTSQKTIVKRADVRLRKIRSLKTSALKSPKVPACAAAATGKSVAQPAPAKS